MNPAAPGQDARTRALHLPNGQHLADRLAAAQKVQEGSVYLMGEPAPTPTQISAVLHALADHTTWMHILTSPEVADLGADRAHLGPGWQHASAIGRILQGMGDHLERDDRPRPSGPTPRRSETGADRG